MKLILISIILIAAITCEAQSISPNKARSRVGNVETVCGTVSSSQFTTQVEGNPSFICFGNPYPNQVFSIVVFEENLGKFAYNPVDLKETEVCVTGKIEMYLGKPAIIVTDPAQIERK